MLIFRRARLAAAVVTETPVVLGLVAAVVLPRTVVLIGPGATSREAVGRTLRIGDRRRQRRLPEHREKHRSSGPHQRELTRKHGRVGSAECSNSPDPRCESSQHVAERRNPDL